MTSTPIVTITITCPDGRMLQTSVRIEDTADLFANLIEHWLSQPNIYFRHGGRFYSPRSK